VISWKPDGTVEACADEVLGGGAALGPSSANTPIAVTTASGRLTCTPPAPFFPLAKVEW
jgi:hypothetical protein